jgi:hypothetical protein
VTKLRWNSAFAAYSECGRYMIQSGSIYHGPGVPRMPEYTLFFFMPGTSDVKTVGIYGRRRDAKAAAQHHADAADSIEE